MSEPRVFVIGPGAGHDYSAAMRFGRAVAVGVGGCNPFNTDALVQELSAAFTERQITDRDFVVLGSSAVLNALACAWIAARFGKLRLLIYGAQRKDYTPRDVSFQRGAGGPAAPAGRNGHVFYEREDELQHCKICGGAESSLPTQCPQRKLLPAEEAGITDGALDYVGGAWVTPAPGGA